MQADHFVYRPTFLCTGRPFCIQANLLCYFLLNKNQRRWRRSDHSYLGRTQKFCLFWPKSYISKFWLDQSDCLIRFFSNGRTNLALLPSPLKRVHVSRKLNSLFILYISTAKPVSLVRGYIEVKISKHDIW